MEIKKFNEYEKIEEGMGFGFGPGMLMCTTTIPVQTGPKVYKTSHILNWYRPRLESELSGNWYVGSSPIFSA